MSSRIFFMLSAIVFLLAVACTVSDGLEEDDAVSAETSTTPDSTTDQSDLEVLALRLISPYYGFPGAPEPSESSLLVGELPENYAFPMPVDTTILGTHYQENGTFRIVADSTLDPDKLLAFFSTEMETLGWKEPEMPHMAGGFVGGVEGVSFCDPDDDMRTIAITANDYIKDAPTDLQINLSHYTDYSPCVQETNAHGGKGIYGLLPQMKQPPGARQTTGGGGSSGINNASTSATLETDLSSAEIIAHYRGELEAKGWLMSSEEIVNTVATSSWQWQDTDGTPYIGTFVTLKNELLPNQSLVLFEMIKAP